jgi:hypothetical protein
MTPRPLALALVAALGIVAVPASAQCTVNAIPASCTQSRTVQITVRRTIRPTVTPSVVTAPGPTATDFNAGFQVVTGPTVNIRSNANWTLRIRSTSTTWAASGGARTNKPRADLLWSTTGGPPFTAMSGTLTTIASGTRTGGSNVAVTYRINWFWALDRPGTYTLPIQFNLIAP